MIMNGIKTDGKGGLLPALDQDILNKQHMLKAIITISITKNAKNDTNNQKVIDILKKVHYLCPQ